MDGGKLQVLRHFILYFLLFVIISIIITLLFCVWVHGYRCFPLNWHCTEDFSTESLKECVTWINADKAASCKGCEINLGVNDSCHAGQEWEEEAVPYWQKGPGTSFSLLLLIQLAAPHCVAEDGEECESV